MKVDILYKVVLRVGMARGRRKGRKGLRRKGWEKGRENTYKCKHTEFSTIRSHRVCNQTRRILIGNRVLKKKGEEKEEDCRHENSIASVGLRQPSTTSLTSLRIVRTSISDEDQ